MAILELTCTTRLLSTERNGAAEKEAGEKMEKKKRNGGEEFLFGHFFPVKVSGLLDAQPWQVGSACFQGNRFRVCM